MARSHLSTLLLLFAACTLTGLWAGCDEDARPAAWDRWGDTGTAPELLERRHGRPALTDLDGLYLGQPAEEGRTNLESYCDDPVRREQEGSGAYFLGCPADQVDGVEMIRVGFWPRIDERVATLEVKRTFVAPPAVWSALQPFVDSATETNRTAQTITALDDNWRFFADWDQGYDGPVHLTVGLDPDVTEATFD